MHLSAHFDFLYNTDIRFRCASSKKAPLLRGVCVNHLNRCKKIYDFNGEFGFVLSVLIPFSAAIDDVSHINFAGGCRECHSSAANEAGYDIL